MINRYGSNIPRFDGTYLPEHLEDLGDMRQIFNVSDMFDWDQEGSVWLPPRELQKRPSEPLETPVDERGLVKIPELLKAVLDTVEPEYKWPMHKLSNHHFYWPASWYDVRPHGLVNPAAFRDLSIHKGKLPRVFENWLHEVTLPPPVPSEEVMHYRVESWKVAFNLFNSVQDVVVWERRTLRRRVDKHGTDDRYALNLLAEIIDRSFEGVEQHMEALAKVPPEFRLVEPTSTPKELAASIGSLVIPRAIRLANPIEALRRPSLAMVA